jgi:hypothetical protein
LDILKWPPELKDGNCYLISNVNMLILELLQHCHSRESGNPDKRTIEISGFLPPQE